MKNQTLNKQSIINLFQRMDSNVTKFYSSVKITTNIQQFNCECQKQKQCKYYEKQLYQDQFEIVKNAAKYFQDDDGNQTYYKFLTFMSEYLAKILYLLGKEMLCQCKKVRIQQSQTLHSKINFLRDQNHKYFKLVQQKTEELQDLKSKIVQIQDFKTNHVSSMVTQSINGRSQSSTSSRISQFKHFCPQIIDMSDANHNHYFRETINQKCLGQNTREALRERIQNLNTSKADKTTDRKIKIFNKS